MKKREPPKIGDLVCLTYNTQTIGIVTEIWDKEQVSVFRYKVEWLKDSDKVLSKQNGTKFGHYCDSVLMHLEDIC